MYFTVNQIRTGVGFTVLNIPGMELSTSVIASFMGKRRNNRGKRRSGQYFYDLDQYKDHKQPKGVHRHFHTIVALICSLQGITFKFSLKFLNSKSAFFLRRPWQEDQKVSHPHESMEVVAPISVPIYLPVQLVLSKPGPSYLTIAHVVVYFLGSREG